MSDVLPTELNEEDVIVGENNWVCYKVSPGHFGATPTIYQGHDKAEGRWEIIFKSGCRKCSIEDLSQCHDWMKACGDKFGGITAPNNRDNVMMAWRFLPDDDADRETGVLAVTPFLNIDGTQNNLWFNMGQYDPRPDWPMIEIDTGRVVAFQYVQSFPDSLDIQIEYEGVEHKLRVWHPNITSNVRTIGVWAGGSHRTNHPMTIYRRRVCMP